MKLFAHVKQIEHQHDAAEPEAEHRDRVEERPLGPVAEVRKLDADEADEIQHDAHDLHDARDGADVLRVVPYVRLDDRLLLRHGGRLRELTHGVCVCVCLCFFPPFHNCRSNYTTTLSLRSATLPRVFDVSSGITTRG